MTLNQKENKKKKSSDKWKRRNKTEKLNIKLLITVFEAINDTPSLIFNHL